MATQPSEVGFAQLLYSGISFMLLAAVTLIVFVVAYQRRILKQQLRLQQVETEHQRELLAAAVEAQEKERERIGQDLHDGLGSALATARMLVYRLRGGPTTAGQPAALALLDEVVSAMGQDVRSIAHNMYPAALARFGLTQALHYLVATANEAGRLPVRLEANYTQALDLTQELALYRICQELLANAFKHAAGATELHIRLWQQERHLTLTVTDDGAGFGATAAAGDGAGLRSIAARVRLLGGQLSYPPPPTSRGTYTVIEVPLPSAIPGQPPQAT